jgi:hypothetical protein
MILATGPLVASQPFSTLEERMTGQEFRETGLHKLSDEELAALNRWIRMRSLTLEEPQESDATERPPATAEAATETTGDQRGFEGNVQRSPITSRIAGTFTGWRGNTEFELENGMVWRQAENDTFAVRAMENPEVTISPGFLGTWRLSVEGYGSSVRVERVR